jgi:hypothetical protein
LGRAHGTRQHHQTRPTTRNHVISHTVCAFCKQTRRVLAGIVRKHGLEVKSSPSKHQSLRPLFRPLCTSMKMPTRPAARRALFPAQVAQIPTFSASKTPENAYTCAMTQLGVVEKMGISAVDLLFHVPPVRGGKMRSTRKAEPWRILSVARK